MPDHKLAIIPCSTSEEADYIAAFLNSDVANLIVRSYAVATGISTHVLERVAMPRYYAENQAHKKLAAIGEKARIDQLSNDERNDASMISAKILGLSDEDAKLVVKQLAKL